MVLPSLPPPPRVARVAAIAWSRAELFLLLGGGVPWFKDTEI